MAVLAVIGMTLGLICAFYIGVRVGREENQLSSTGRERDEGNGKTKGEGSGNGIKTTRPRNVGRIEVGTKPKTPAGSTKRTIATPTGGSGKWTVEVYRYNASERRVAERMVQRLEAQGLRGVWIGQRTVRGRKQLCVCVGRFQSRSDPAAERLKQTVINLNRQRYATLVEIVKLD
jgi:hypothetical protein